MGLRVLIVRWYNADHYVMHVPYIADDSEETLDGIARNDPDEIESTPTRNQICIYNVDVSYRMVCTVAEGWLRPHGF